MRYSKFLLPTSKDAPSDADSVSMKYMYRAGMIRKVSAGLFHYLPYFNMIMRKVNYRIRRGMEKLDSQEMKFPILVAKETLEKSNRWTAFGKEMFSLVDRNGNGYAISPTNEEYATLVNNMFVKSYNDLPFSIYQIQQKHRDEIRPRNGVVRAREFTMKDAYSSFVGEIAYPFPFLSVKENISLPNAVQRLDFSSVSLLTKIGNFISCELSFSIPLLIL